MLLLFASEVAALIGKNPYKPQWEAFEQLWARFVPEQYAAHQECLANYVSLELDRVHTAAVERAVQTPMESAQDVQAVEQRVVSEVMKQVDLEAEARVAQAAAALGVDASAVASTPPVEALTVLAQQTQNAAATQLLQEATKLVQQRDAVASKAASSVRCAYGTAKEERSRAQLVKATSVKVQHTNKFHSTTLGMMPYANVQWGIGGRLDGLDAQGRVVEIKNRTRRFFTVIPEYERVQVACYLKIMRATKALLVQQYNGEQRVTEIDDEGPRWSLYLSLMTAVVTMLDLFVADDSVALRHAWVTCDGGEDKQALLTQWLAEQQQVDKEIK